MTDQSDQLGLMPGGLQRSWSREEVEQAFGISKGQINKLIKSGVVGYILGKNRKRRFMAEHIGQIRAAITGGPRRTTLTAGPVIT